MSRMKPQGKGRMDRKPTGRFGDLLTEKKPEERLPGRMEVKRLRKQDECRRREE